MQSKLRKFLAAAFLALMVGMQAVEAQTTRSVTIQIIGIVQPYLKLSLDFAPDGIATVLGYLGDAPAGGAFTIRSNTMFLLGTARLVSNLMSSYTVVVRSVNGGKLRHRDGHGEVPYTLIIGNQPAVRQGDTFCYVTSGRTSFDGTEVPVSIALGEVSESAGRGLYSDSLQFSIVAN